MKVFGEKLKELRQEKNLSIEKLSKQIQFSTASICRWENDKADILASELVVVAKFFGVTTDYLLGLED